MSLFGELDAAEISSNPFKIDAGEYESEITAAEYRTDRDGRRQLYLKYTITDTNSEFKGESQGHFFPLVDADMTHEKLEMMPLEERQKIRKDNANVKRTLCGNPGHKNQPGLGVDPDDLNQPDWNPASLLGTPVIMCINNFGTNNQGTGIRWVNVIQDPSDTDS